MAGVAPAPGAAPTAPARLTVGPASTTLSVSPVPPASATEQLRWELPRDSPAIKSLSFVSFSVPPAPARVEIEAIQIVGVSLAASNFLNLPAAEQTALAQANMVVDFLDRARCSEILHELAMARIFEVEYEDLEEFASAVVSSSLINKASLAIRVAHISQGDPFDTPAVPGRAARGRVAAVRAVPAVPGPTELEPIRKVSWASVLREARSVFPDSLGVLLAYFACFLGLSERAATRRDEASYIRLGADTLFAYVSEASRLGPSPSATAVASCIPRYLVRLHQVMPATLRSSSLSWAEIDTLLRDSHALLVGRSSETIAVTWSRIHHRLHKFEVLRHFHLQSPGVSDTRVQLSRLIARYLDNTSADPLVLITELDRVLAEARKGTIISDLFSAGSSIAEVVDTLLGARDAIGSAESLGGDAGGTVVAGGTSGASGNAAISASALERGMNSDFRETADEASGKEGLELLGVVCASSSVLILRFLYDGTPFLLTKHEVFGSIAKALVDRRAHLAYSVVVDASTGEVPAARQIYQLTQKQNDHFWSLNFEQLDMVNVDPAVPSTGGFLALRFIDTGATYNHVDPSQHYIVEACLLGLREWFDGCLLGGGYSSTPSSGYTWFEVVDKQLVLVRYLYAAMAIRSTRGGGTHRGS